MKTVGDKFPAFSLPGINEKNEFVQVNVDEGYTPHKKDWSVVYFYPKDFTFYLSNRNRRYGRINRPCKCNWY